jgi:hypothetical protein
MSRMKGDYIPSLARDSQVTRAYFNVKRIPARAHAVLSVHIQSVGSLTLQTSINIQYAQWRRQESSSRSRKEGTTKLRQFIGLWASYRPSGMLLSQRSICCWARYQYAVPSVCRRHVSVRKWELPLRSEPIVERAPTHNSRRRYVFSAVFKLAKM